MVPSQCFAQPPRQAWAGYQVWTKGRDVQLGY